MNRLLHVPTTCSNYIILICTLATLVTSVSHTFKPSIQWSDVSEGNGGFRPVRVHQPLTHFRSVHTNLVSPTKVLRRFDSPNAVNFGKVKIRNNISSTYNKNEWKPQTSEKPKKEINITQKTQDMIANFSRELLNENETIDYKLNNESKIEFVRTGWPMKVWNCIRSRSIMRCMRIFLMDCATQAMEQRTKTAKSNITVQWFEEILLQNAKDNSSSYSKYANFTDEELDHALLEILLKLFDKKVIKFYILPNVEFQMQPAGDSVDLSIRLAPPQPIEMARGKNKMQDFFPYLFIPSVLWTTFLPLVLPGIKMAVMTAMMINQLAFGMALMGLIRSVIFDPRPSDQIVYVNEGYRHEPPPPPQHHHIEQPIHIQDVHHIQEPISLSQYQFDQHNFGQFDNSHQLGGAQSIISYSGNGDFSSEVLHSSGSQKNSVTQKLNYMPEKQVQVQSAAGKITKQPSLTTPKPQKTGYFAEPLSNKRRIIVHEVDDEEDEDK